MKKALLSLIVAFAAISVQAENLKFAYRPSLSPDGQTIWFSYDGDIRQLTFNEASGTPYSWSPDSKYICFDTARASARKTTFRVSVDGGHQPRTRTSCLQASR